MIERNNCKICKEFRENCKKIISKIPDNENKVVHGSGDYDANTIFIGEGPGKLGAALSGVAFTKDYSGIVIQKSLIELGYSANDSEDIDENFIPNENSIKCYITNVFRCHSYKPLGKISKKNELFKNYREHCNGHLSNEITNLKNLKKIIIIGTSSTKNSIQNLKELNKIYDVTSITHPAYYKRRGFSIEESVIRFIEEFKNK